MSLRLKMIVYSVKRHAGPTGDIESEEITLNAVCGPAGSVNSEWAKWTPSAGLSFTVNNPGAFNQILPGQFYFLDFIPTNKDS